MSESDKPQLSRRGLIFGGVAAGLAGAGTAIALSQVSGAGTPNYLKSLPEAEAELGSSKIPFYGEHQAGIAQHAQANANFIAMDLKDGSTVEDARRLMRLLSDDAARMTQGKAALADLDLELSSLPANLTVTFGFGPGFVEKLNLPRPDWLTQLPAFGIDRLQDEWSGGDLLIQVASDDAMTVEHSSRVLMRDASDFATVKWSQVGFRRAAGSTQSGVSMRNLFGQVDGTVNLVDGTQEFDELVWNTDGWTKGGTSVVIRRIHMDLDKWDELDRIGREDVIGRKLANGAPLTGTDENDEPDFDAKLASGFTVIPDFSHMRRARGDDTSRGATILRRPYNYSVGPGAASVSTAGLIFASYQANPIEQFVPIQTRLDKLDILNTWTTPIGSAVFAIPPGCEEGGYIGETLLRS